MTPLPRAEAIPYLERLRDESSDATYRLEVFRAALMRQSPRHLGRDHPDAIGSREMDRLIHPGRPANEINGSGRQFIAAGFNNIGRMTKILGYDPLAGPDREGVAVTPTPATPPANQEA